MDFEFLVTDTLEALAPLFVQRGGDLAWLQRLAGRLQRLLDDTPVEALDFGLCYGEMREYIGDAWLDDNYYDFHMRFIRTWVKQHLGKL